MPQYDIARDFIEGFQSGQTARKTGREEAYAREDRSVEKELLAHRLRTIKLQEKLDARTLAKENLGFRSGRPQSQIPENHLEPLTNDQLQGDRSSGMIATMPETIQPAQRRMKPVNIPGVPELGVEDDQVTPQTMEELIGLMAQEAAAKRFGETKVIGQGGVLTDNYGRIIQDNPRTFAPPNPQGVDITQSDGRVRRDFVTPREGLSIDRGMPPDNTLVPVTERDENGVETTTYKPRPQAAGTTSVRQPLPTNTAANPRAYAAEQALAAIDELERILNTKTNVKTKSSWHGMDSPDPEYADALSMAQQALASFYAGGNSPNESSIGKAEEVLGNNFSNARIRLALPGVKKLIQSGAGAAVAHGPKRGGGGGGNPAPAPTKTSSRATIGPDGLLYINGVAVGEP